MLAAGRGRGSKGRPACGEWGHFFIAVGSQSCYESASGGSRQSSRKAGARGRPVQGEAAAGAAAACQELLRRLVNQRWAPGNIQGCLMQPLYYGRVCLQSRSFAMG
jgi:hypothetical protein